MQTHELFRVPNATHELLRLTSCDLEVTYLDLLNSNAIPCICMRQGEVIHALHELLEVIHAFALVARA